MLFMGGVIYGGLFMGGVIYGGKSYYFGAFGELILFTLNIICEHKIRFLIIYRRLLIH